MMNEQELHATLMRLPPAPWHAEGNVVKAGTFNIAFVKLSRPGFPASFIARMLAMLPDLLKRQMERDEAHDEQVATLQSKVEELEERLSELELERDALKDEIDDLKNDE